MNKLYLFVVLLFCIAPAAMAQQMQAESPLSDTAQEQRARALFYELRCEVCAGQSIGDSNAALAQDMRILVRQKVAEGASNVEILHYFSSRYGNDILMRPPLNTDTAPLWMAPVFLLLLGGWFLMRYFAQKRKHTQF